MKATFEQQKKEACYRLRLLNVRPEIIDKFTHGLIPTNDTDTAEPTKGGPLERIRRLEAQTNALVYYMIRSSHQFASGEMNTEAYLFVGDNPEEWPLDRNDIDGEQTTGYVYNVTDPKLSGFGLIGIQRTPAGGLRRTW